jgi:hypothetical protein
VMYWINRPFDPCIPSSIHYLLFMLFVCLYPKRKNIHVFQHLFFSFQHSITTAYPVTNVQKT